MDEPLSNLDAQLRSKMRIEIMRMHEQIASTMVYVTHDQLEALSMGDKVGVLLDGRLEQIGTALEIYRHPRTLFVAQFIGNPMMNIVPIDEVTESHIVWRSHSIPISEHQRSALSEARTNELLLLLGIRAEHISIKGSRWATGTEPESMLTAVVSRVELAGDQQFLTIAVDSVELTARCEPDFAVAAGQTLSVWFDPEHLHIFDEETGEALVEVAR
jgi:multiple sugar transport system ATP-binding protein